MARISDLLNPNPADAVPYVYEAVFARNIGSSSEMAEVVIPAFDPDQMWGPMPWPPRGDALPQAGARCIVALAETDHPGTAEPWIVGWWDGEGASFPTPASDVLIAPGMMFPYALSTAPSGYMITNGDPVTSTSFPLRALLLADGSPYGVSSGNPRVPDTLGRILIAKGTHAEVDTLGDSDGLAVGSRKVKHRHGKGNLSINASGGHGQHTRTVDGITTGAFNIGTMSAGTTTLGAHAHGVGDFAGEVGDTAGPLDGPAFVVINYIIKL